MTQAQFTKQILQAILHPTYPTGRAGFALLLLRVLVGTAFLFHGSGKAGELEAFAREFNIPISAATFAAYAQLAGGVLLIGGLFTWLGAALIAGTMATATAKLIERGEPFVNPAGHSWEASSFYLVACVVILLLGPGRYSLDALPWVGGRLRRLGAAAFPAVLGL